MTFKIAASSDIGILSNINQDSFTVKRANTCIGEVAFAAVCDGMGGVSCGELASATVMQMFNDWFGSSFALFCESEINKETIEFYWRNIIDRANACIMQYSAKKNIVMGTTATVLMLTPKEYYCLNVGDSRTYLLNDGIIRITRDHSYVQQEIDLGNINEDEALVHPHRNVLLQSIGCTENLNPDFFSGHYNADDIFLLCSDGLRHELSEKEIFEIVDMYNCNESYNKAIGELIENNKIRGEKDNITAVLIKAKSSEDI